MNIDAAFESFNERRAQAMGDPERAFQGVKMSDEQKEKMLEGLGLDLAELERRMVTNVNTVIGMMERGVIELTGETFGGFLFDHFVAGVIMGRSLEGEELIHK